MESDFPIPEKCTAQKWSEFILVPVPYAKNFKEWQQKDFCLSLFSKLLERRHLGTGIHSYSVILEPKRASNPPPPPPSSCQPITKHSSGKLPTARLPAGFAFAEVTFFWHYPGGPGFLPLGSQPLSLLFASSALPPLCGNLLCRIFMTIYGTVRENGHKIDTNLVTTPIWNCLTIDSCPT